jgi:hypothetical protein
MGYFANGTEGEIYESMYCDECAHNPPLLGCPALEAHRMWNYDECNKPDSILHRIIPRNGVENGKCIFFSGREPGGGAG